jgi:phosphatidate cytidylyltransferase
VSHSNDDRETPGSDEPITRLEQAIGDIEATYQEWETQVKEATAKIDERAGRPLWQAIAVGLLLGGAFVASLLFTNLLFFLFIAVLMALAVIELVTALREKGSRLPRTWMVVVSLAVVSSGYLFGADGMLLGLFVAIVAVVVGRLIDSAINVAARPTLLRDVQGGIFVVVYIPFLASFAIVTQSSDAGQWWVFAGVVIVVAIDTAAYATGLAIGKHKLAPQISPGKTWEGLGGATLAALVAGMAFGQFLLGIGWLAGAVVALLLVGSATMGDLVESLIKRDLGIKDMSSLLPGHGGFMDRLDSLLPSMAVVYIAYQLFG